MDGIITMNGEGGASNQKKYNAMLRFGVGEG